jgi:hypothetical protein
MNGHTQKRSMGGMRAVQELPQVPRDAGQFLPVVR